MFFILLRVPAPFGRFGGDKSGWRSPILDKPIASWLGWFLMEFPSVACFVWSMALDPSRLHRVEYRILSGMFLGHYLYRSLVFSWMQSPKSRRMSLRIILSAAAYTSMNGYLNGRGLHHFNDELPSLWFRSILFWTGSALWLVGFIVNVHSDRILRNLRSSRNGGDDAGYFIPYGGLFRFVSCPNYLGEMIEWFGWAVATRFSPAAVSFSYFTLMNLVPRALATHQWYLGKFHPEYESLGRRALVPFIL